MTPLQRAGLWLVGFVLVVIFAISTLGVDLSLSQFSAPAEAPPSTKSVDQSFYATARNLAGLAATPQEQQYAVLAMRAADYELDQSFATAIRRSLSRRLTLTPEAATALRHASELKQAIRADEAGVSAASGEQMDDAESEDTSGRLRVAQAQLALDQDELDNVQQDLSRLGGNQQTEVQQAFDQHRSIEGQAAALPKNTAMAPLESPRSLQSAVGKVRVLSLLKDRQRALAEAQRKAIAAQKGLQQQRDVLARTGEAAGKGEEAESSAARLTRLRASSEREKDVAELDKRVRDLGQLAAVYNDWNRLLETQRSALHAALIADFLRMLMAFLGIFALSGFAQYLIRRWEKSHHHRLNHARVVITLILELIIVARVAVVLFGMPGDVSTIIGFITAGITVTLKDFLVSFVGWFALMGRRGIQVGDWVEIDGTQGEVAEITALHTFLLETGNWTTSGQFTGRQAVFMNKYAVERKYFNFSTPQQWLWDELVIPATASMRIDPALLQKLRELVEQETRHDLGSAEEAWREMVVTHGLHERKLTPLVVVRSSAAGLEVVVRYATKAPERFDSAVRLRQAVLDALSLGVSPDSGRANGECKEKQIPKG